MIRSVFCSTLLLLASIQALAQQAADVASTREMERINWMEFRDVVPSKIQTVLLPTGR